MRTYPFAVLGHTDFVDFRFHLEAAAKLLCKSVWQFLGRTTVTTWTKDMGSVCSRSFFHCLFLLSSVFRYLHSFLKTEGFLKLLFRVFGRRLLAEESSEENRAALLLCTPQCWYRVSSGEQLG